MFSVMTKAIENYDFITIPNYFYSMKIKLVLGVWSHLLTISQ